MTDCRCTFTQHMVGDGCDVCNQTKALEYAYGTIGDQRTEIDRLRAERNALRTFAQKVVMETNNEPTLNVDLVLQFAAISGLVKEVARGVYVDTSLLTGEGQT